MQPAVCCCWIFFGRKGEGGEKSDRSWPCKERERRERRRERERERERVLTKKALGNSRKAGIIVEGLAATKCCKGVTIKFKI